MDVGAAESHAVGPSHFGSNHFGSAECYDEHYNENYEEAEIGALSRGEGYFNCGGWGHMSRDCPSETKGKAKARPDT